MYKFLLKLLVKSRCSCSGSSARFARSADPASLEGSNGYTCYVISCYDRHVYIMLFDMLYRALLDVHMVSYVCYTCTCYAVYVMSYRVVVHMYMVCYT